MTKKFFKTSFITLIVLISIIPQVFASFALIPGGVVALQSVDEDGSKVVVLGSKSMNQDYPSFEAFEHLGFDISFYSGSTEKVEPSFLIFVDSKGELKKVHSFELGQFKKIPSWMYAQAKAKNQINTIRVYDKLNNPKEQASLPPTVLDVPHTRRNLFLRFLAKSVLFIAGFSDLSPMTAIVGLGGKQADKIRDKSGSYLGELAYLAIQEKPELAPMRAVFTEEQIKKLGAALYIRYNFDSRWHGLRVKTSNQVADYENHLKKLDSRFEIHYKELERSAAKKDLSVAILAPGFALVYKPEPKEHLDPRKNFLGVDLSERLEKVKPYAIYALGEKMKNFETLNIKHPNSTGNKQQIVDIAHGTLTMAYSVIPFPTSAFMEGGVELFKKIVEWLGYTFFQYRLASFGRLQANLKSGVVSFNSDSTLARIDADALLKTATAVGISEDEVSRIKESYDLASPHERGQVLAYILNEVLDTVARRASLFEEFKPSKVKELKLTHFARFKNWIEKGRAIKARKQAIAARDASVLR